MIERRRFIQTSAASIAASQILRNNRDQLQADDKQVDVRKIVVGVMGQSRGKELAQDLMKIPNVDVRYACDTDIQRAESGAKMIADAGGSAKAIQDFRVMLDDPAVDAIFCAAPNHWHGPAAILGCKAGKHVYVEKPACHNPQEGEWMVAAANKFGKCVQVGTQRRSSKGYQEAVAKIHAGAIGKVYLARAFFSRMRGPTGTKVDSAPPKNLDYALWQGPAPHRPFRENVVHYNWHWFWHWGNGELGNNGVHSLDICRWILQVDYPTRTTSTGGRLRYHDDQQTPDTHCVEWEFEGGKLIAYQGLSCVKQSPGPFVSAYGYDGYMEIDGDGAYKIFNNDGRVVESAGASGWGQLEHITNFIDAVRANDPARLNQPILSGHKSTLLCHLGNIAYRTGSTIVTQPHDGHITDAAIASKHWRREYDPQWEKLISEI